MKRPLKTIAVLAAAMAVTLAGPFASSAQASGLSQNDGMRSAVASSAQANCVGRRPPIYCSVTEPNVTQRATDYPEIQLFAGDHVYIEAGGCVQTGGSGLTWKRYVNPASDNDLYHGLINILGTTSNDVHVFRRLLDVVNRTVVVNSNTILRLGYEDDHYGDNGYWGHDNGTGNQCRNSVNAWVRLTIT